MTDQELTTSVKGGAEIRRLLYSLVWLIALDVLEQAKNESNARFLSKFRSIVGHFKDITSFACYRLAWKI